jgi:hypothetical protein
VLPEQSLSTAVTSSYLSFHSRWLRRRSWSHSVIRERFELVESVFTRESGGRCRFAVLAIWSLFKKMRNEYKNMSDEFGSNVRYHPDFPAYLRLSALESPYERCSHRGVIHAIFPNTFVSAPRKYRSRFVIQNTRLAGLFLKCVGKNFCSCHEAREYSGG